MRRILSLFLILCLPLQVLAMQTGGNVTGHAFDIHHEIEHQQGVTHHHDQDGTVHYSDADESTQHATDHACSQVAPSLPSAQFQIPYAVPHLAISISPQVYKPDYVPDGLQRPPSALG